MSTHDHPTGATPPPARPTAGRPDVLTARSRMRTKYGAQLEIEQVAGELEPGEVLLHLAVTRGSALGTRSAHGLLALSDLRLRYVPKGSARTEGHSTDVSEIVLLSWAPDSNPSTGTLSITSTTDSRSYAGVGRADGRDLMASIRGVRPAVRYVEPPTP